MRTVMQMILTVEPTDVGQLIADLSGRVKSIEFNTVVLKDGRAHNKGRRPKRGPYKKKAKRGGTRTGNTAKILAVADGLTTAQVIERTGLPPKTVYNALNRSRRLGRAKRSANGTWKVTK